MVDLTFLRKFTKDDPVKMKRYISLYLDVAPKTFSEMDRYLKDKDWEQLRIHAHSLKPQADFMGIQNLKEHFIKIEEAVQSNQLDGIEELFDTALILSREAEQSLGVVMGEL